MSGSRVHFSHWRVITAVTCLIIWLALLTVVDGSHGIAQNSDTSRALQSLTEMTVDPPSSQPREQLGMELKSGKAPVDVLVIDHVEPPMEN